MRLKFLLFTVVCFLTLMPRFGWSLDDGKKTRILFLLDGSGSMLADWEGATRMEKAKQVLAELVTELDSRENLEIGLRVYGHQFDRKEQNCEDSRLEVGFAAHNSAAVISALDKIKPKGTTPLAYSMEKAASDFSGQGDYRNVIVIITDGVESCDGDPCQVAIALQRKNVFLRPFIIGLGGQEAFAQAFDCLGEYYDASNVQGLRNALDQIVKATLGKTTVKVNLLDANGKPTVTGVNLSFINAVTGATEYDIVHYLDKGQTDALEIDAVRSYHLMVNTVPPIYRKNIKLKGGEENVIDIPAPQGNLTVRMDQHQQYQNLRVVIRESGKSNIVANISAFEPVQLLAGSYDVEVLTLPVRENYNVKVLPDRVSNIDLPTPGVLSITDNTAGFGSIYELIPNGVEMLIQRLEEKGGRQNITMQPGRYKLVFRSANSRGSRFTKVQYFEIRSGLTTKLSLY